MRFLAFALREAGKRRMVRNVFKSLMTMERWSTEIRPTALKAEKVRLTV